MVLRTKRYADRVIVVDDGSSDRTAEVAELAGAEVIRHLENRGKGAALKTGFEAVNDLQEEAYRHLTGGLGLKGGKDLRSGPEVIVTMDTDGHHDPSDIPKLIEPILRGEADMVNGSRYVNGNRKDTQFYRRTGQVVLDNAIRLDSGLNITDSQSGFRAFAGHTKGAFRFNQKGLAIEGEMLVDAANAGLRIKEVEIGVRSNADGSSENPVIDGVLTIAAMPAYNEERSIAKMILGCRKYVDKVVVVDDGSADATSEIAGALGAYVVRHEQNGGYGAALRTCFETARELDADAMVIIDSDGQHDSADIPKLLKPIKSGMDLVIGSRFCDGNGKNIPTYRKFGMRVLDTATNAAGGIRVTDSQSGFRAYGRRAIDKIRVEGDGMAAGSEILLQAKDSNLKVVEVEIMCRYDVERASTENPVSHGVRVLINLLHDMELRRPLYYFTVPGAVMAVIGVFMGLDFLRTFYHGGTLSFGPTLLMILLTLVGSFMAFTGIILHSLSNLIDRLMKKMDRANASRK